MPELEDLIENRQVYKVDKEALVFFRMPGEDWGIGVYWAATRAVRKSIRGEDGKMYTALMYEQIGECQVEFGSFSERDNELDTDDFPSNWTGEDFLNFSMALSMVAQYIEAVRTCRSGI